MKSFNCTVLAACLLTLSSCEWQSEEVLFAEQETCAEPISFSMYVAPIIQANCAISGCHIAGGQPPELDSYEKVKDHASNVLQVIQSGTMPPSSSGKSLREEEIKQIACWVEQGMPRD